MKTLFAITRRLMGVRIRINNTRANPISKAVLNRQTSCTTTRVRVCAALLLLVSGNVFAMQIAVQTPSTPIPQVFLSGLPVNITVSNPDSTAAKDVRLVFEYPRFTAGSNLTDFDLGNDANTVSCGGFSSCGPGDTVTIDLNTIAAGDAVTIGFYMLILRNNLSAEATTRIDAAVQVEGNEEASVEHVIPMVLKPDVSVSLDSKQGAVQPGAKILYTVSYSQVVAPPLQTSSLTFQMPTGTSFVTATNSPTVNGRSVVWDIGTFESASVGEQQVVVQVDSSGLNNGSLLVAEATFSGQDSGLDNKQASVQRINHIDDRTLPEVAVILHKQRVEKGDIVRTAITVSNPTSTAMSNVQLFLRYPAKLALSVATNEIDIGGSANTIDCNGISCDPGKLMQVDLKRIAAGAAVTVDMTTYFNTPLPGNMVPIDAYVRVDGKQVNSANDTYLAHQQPWFNLSVNTDQNPVKEGNTVTYILDYSNVSDLLLNQGKLIFPIPAPTRYVSASGDPALVTGLLGSELHWDLADLEPGELGQQRVIVEIPSGSVDNGNLIQTEATISGTDPGSEIRELRSSDAVRVRNGASPGLSFEFLSQEVGLSEPVNVAVTVTNPTTKTLNDVHVLLRQPNGVIGLGRNTFDTGGDANTGACFLANCNEGGLLELDLNTLPVGEGVTFNFRALRTNVSSPGGDLIPYEASLRVNGLQQAHASDHLKIVEKPFFTLNVDTPSDPVNTGVQLKYTLKYGNLSALTSQNTRLYFPLPQGMDFVSATNGGALSDNTVVWTLGSLAGGETYQQEVILQANTGELSEGALLTEQARLTGDDVSTNSYSVRQLWNNRVEGGQKPELNVVIDEDPIAPRMRLSLKLEVRNPTSSPLRNVSLLLRYPEYMAGVLESAINTGGAANTVDCVGTSCESGELAVFDLNTILAGETARIDIPIASITPTLDDGSLIPVHANVRVNGVQQAASMNTYRVDRSPTPVSPINAIELSVGVVDRTQYGWKYGTSNHGQSVRFKFEGAGEDLLLTLRGYDIDDKDEVTVWLNDVRIGELIVSKNNQSSDFNRILVSAQRQISGTNILEFRQKEPGFKYGISSVKLRPMAGPVVSLTPGVKNTNAYGYRFGRTSTHPGVVPMTFPGGTEDLFLSLVGYDIDSTEEVGVWLNGTQLGSLKKGRNNQLGPVTRLFVPLDRQISGTNQLQFIQQKPGNIYGIKNVFLRAALGPIIPLKAGIKDSNSYGYRFFRASLHATRLQAEFDRIDDDVRISVRAYDIDTNDEVSVFLNGNFLGNLRESGNLLEKSTAFTIPKASIQDTNVLEFRQLVPGNRWGIRNLLVRAAP